MNEQFPGQTRHVQCPKCYTKKTISRSGTAETGPVFKRTQYWDCVNGHYFVEELEQVNAVSIQTKFTYQDINKKKEENQDETIN